MGTPTLSSHPLGTHAKLGETDDTQLHYPKGFVAADDNTMIVKGNDSEIAYIPAIYTDKITVTSAELLAIHTTPKTIISAKGSGTTQRIMSLATFMDYGSSTYVATDDLTLQYATKGTLAGNIDTTAITDTDDRWQTGTATLKDVEIADNEDINLTSATNPTTGDGTLYIYVTYQILG